MKVTALPSMIRVDAQNRMEVVYDEVSEALGEEAGYFDSAEFEENMSTHYGRMIHEDDRTIMFANPEDAAEYIGFDLNAHSAPTPRSTGVTAHTEEDPVYEKNGEKYFVVDSHMHYWDASPENWVAGQEQYAKGWIECFHAYQGLGPAGDPLVDREVPEVLRAGPDEGRVRGRVRRHRGVPADLPQGVVQRGLQHHRAEWRAG